METQETITLRVPRFVTRLRRTGLRLWARLGRRLLPVPANALFSGDALDVQTDLGECFVAIAAPGPLLTDLLVSATITTFNWLNVRVHVNLHRGYPAARLSCSPSRRVPERETCCRIAMF